MNMKPLHQDELASPAAITALGTLAIKHLHEHGEISFFFTEDMYVQIAMPGEFVLDALPEPEAITSLASAGRTDIEIELYLRGRDARMKRRHG